MISVLLYGRNDSYGYNLHKRAALSFNCIAEVLTDPADEIVFIDYNTPDDFPTFPEAIQDTLTPRARRLLRILRVRPRHHQKFAAQTHLMALEPIARNVGLRRSNPDNRWILSTNTDMIFVPRRGRSLSEVAAGLADGYYHLPRFELPETLWESLNRLDASGTIRQMSEWGWKFHLNEIVEAQDPTIRYDGPGDFQLMLRSDLFRIHGFDERMLLGWHVDSNIARRLHLIHGQVDDILDEYFGYHCDHTRQATPAHRPGGVQNSVGTFIDGVTTPFAPEQERSWGLAQETVEEFRLDSGSTTYLQGLRAAISQVQEKPSRIHYGIKTYDRIDYATPHVLPFLADALGSYPRSTKIGWFSARPDLLQAFAAAWTAMGGSQTILVADTSRWLKSATPSAWIVAPLADIAQQADVFVFDWGLPPAAAGEDWEFEHDPAIRDVTAGFRLMMLNESKRLAERSNLPRRFIAVNAINSRCETLFETYIGATRSPLSSRIRQGFVASPLAAGSSNAASPDKADGKPLQELIKQLSVGAAGKRELQGISTVDGVAGHICYGPYIDLQPGWYSVHAKLEPLPAPPGAAPRVLTDTASRILHVQRRLRRASPARIAGALKRRLVRTEGHFGSPKPLLSRNGVEVVSGSHAITFYPITRADLAKGEFSFRFHIPEEVIREELVLAVEFRFVTTGQMHATLTSLTLEETLPEADAIDDGAAMVQLARPDGEHGASNSKAATVPQA